MFTVTRILTIKPGVVVDKTKFDKTDEQKKYIKNKYIKTNKLLRSVRESKLTEEGLIITTTLYWRNHEDYFDFLLDEKCGDLANEQKTFKSFSKEENINLIIKAEITNE
jgi:hypothetical protein